MREPIDVRERDLYTVDQFQVKDYYRQDLRGILISHGEIKSRVMRLAEEISKDYSERSNGEFYPICVLKGAMRFFGDLVSNLQVDIPYREGVVSASRYGMGGDEPDPKASVSFLDPEAIGGRDVLFVEDIIDEGYTLESILNQVEKFDPNSIEIAVLFDKIENRKTDIDAKYTGFIIPDEFVVGYGLDYNERYRNLNHLGVLEPEILES